MIFNSRQNLLQLPPQHSSHLKSASHYFPERINRKISYFFFIFFSLPSSSNLIRASLTFLLRSSLKFKNDGCCDSPHSQLSVQLQYNPNGNISSSSWPRTNFFSLSLLSHVQWMKCQSWVLKSLFLHFLIEYFFWWICRYQLREEDEKFKVIWCCYFYIIFSSLLCIIFIFCAVCLYDAVHFFIYFLHIWSDMQS